MEMPAKFPVFIAMASTTAHIFLLLFDVSNL
jgi:hypothetical protein